MYKKGPHKRYNRKDETRTKERGKESNSGTQFLKASNRTIEKMKNIVHPKQDDELADHVPSNEYYGFVIYLVSFAIFGLYLVWAYFPDRILTSLGLTYYPDRYWALAIPSWLFMCVLFIYYFYFCYLLYSVEPLGSKWNFVDNYSQVPPEISTFDFDVQELGGIPEISDLPIELVNYCLYNNTL